MKKILVLFLLMFSLCLNAQIQRKFFGLELGKSTRNEVTSTLSKQGINVEKSDDGSLIVYDKSFGGEKWDHIIFHFYNNKFYSIIFASKEIIVSSMKSTLKERFTSLKDRLMKKYSKYCVEDKYDSCGFSDKSSICSLRYFKYDNFTWFVSFSYSDSNLVGKQSQSTYDEL